MRMRWVGRAAIMAMLSIGAVAQAPHPLTAADRARIDSILAKMSLEEKIDYIGGTGFAVRAVPGAGLPALQMSDGPLGVRSNKGVPSTTYAAGIALASTWDRSLADAVGGGIGRDARARGVHYMLGPGVNIYRSPHNARNFEYMGEDPYLAGQMATGYILGMQKQGVSATVKHYLGNNAEYARHTADSVIGERALREIYLPAFEAAVKQGHVGAVMDSYNLINGEHATQNAFFNIQVLRKEWGFPGTLMSDWVATYDGVAAANGGLDIEMPTGRFMNKETLLPAVKSGKVSEATIDDKVRHILATALMFGWLDRDQKDSSIPLDDPKDNAVALRSARESVTLLKNEGGLLPLDKHTVKNILVVGYNATPGAPVGGGSGGVKPVHTISLLEGLKAVAPDVHVEYEAGIPSLKAMAQSTNFTTASNGGQAGVLVEQFRSKDLQGPAEKSTVAHIDLTGATRAALAAGGDIGGQHMHALSRRITGYYNVAADGMYLLAMVGSVEGSGERVFLDDRLVIDNWDLKRAAEPHLTLHLTAGVHKLVAESWQERAAGGRVCVGLLPAAAVVSQRAKDLAAKADVVIVSAGFQGTTFDNSNEREGSDRSFDLPTGQDELIQAMEAANPRTIVDVTSGGNVDSERWIEKTPVWVEQWYGGQAEGQALAEVLFGDVDPSGHLPATFERRAEDNPAYANYYPQKDLTVEYREGIFVGYRGYEKNGVKPLFPFGYGLSYTTFQFSHLKVVPGAGAEATVEFDVTNTGKRAGAEVAQVYVGENHPKVVRPQHELKGFERVELKPGETKHVSVALDARSFAYWSEASHGWTIDPGAFTVSVGDSVASLPLTAPLTLSASKVSGAKF